MEEAFISARFAVAPYTDLNGATNILNKYLQSVQAERRVALARLAGPVVRMVEMPKGNDPISKSLPTAIRSAMVESPVL